jgi:hypothetical protein
MSVCNESEIPEEQVINYLEIDTIPPLPLFALFASDNDTCIDSANEQNTNTMNENQQSNDLFDTNPNRYDTELKLNMNDSTLDDEYEFDEERKQRLMEKKLAREKLEYKKILLNLTNNSAGSFNSKVCKLLNEYLTCIQLNGLTSIDQMYLVALADTVANVKCDVIFNPSEDLFQKKDLNENSAKNQTTSETNSSDQIVDNCGLKFLLALRSYNYLMKTLPIPNRDKLKSIGLGTANFAWAFHSECEQDLLNALPKVNNNQNSEIGGDSAANSYLTWADLKQYGIGWWLKNPILLKQLIEKVAKCAFQAKNDPLDAALFYLAMKKKGVLWGLFKTVKDVRMTEFFKNDFSEQKWQTAALKNAYVLLGKQRFEHAAGFFLLAGRLKDAIEVCIRSMKDLQLALVIVRLYESDFDKLQLYIKQILFAEVLGYDFVPDVVASVHGMKKLDSFGTLSKNPNPDQVSLDPFLRSMSYWFVKDYKSALSTLYNIDIGISSTKKKKKINDPYLDASLTGLSHYSSMGNHSNKDSMISHVFNFYTFLKHHPLLLRQQLVEENVSKNAATSTVTSVERRLHFIAAYYHLINGCPLLTLDILSKLPKYISNTNMANNASGEGDDSTSNTKSKEEEKVVEKKVEDFDWSMPSTTTNLPTAQKSDDFDWSTPSYGLSSRFNNYEDELVLDDLKFSYELEDNFDSVDKKKDDETLVNNDNLTDDKKIEDKKQLEQNEKQKKIDQEEQDSHDPNKIIDTFAQQIKFISCLKILIEEMSTLATGFEVVGGQLR